MNRNLQTLSLYIAVLLCSASCALGADDPVVVAAWDFAAEASSLFVSHGAVLRDQAGPRPPEFPDFQSNNTAIGLADAGGYLSIDDPGKESDFDFSNGDAISLEAWVQLDTVAHSSPIYIIGKGRTRAPTFAKDNQNWALRLQKVGDGFRVGFLFATQPATGDAHWHRWTSTRAFPVHKVWHHVAVTYRFGEPDSVRGWIDGRPTDGTWDMGGKTTQPPIVDNDQVWIGSANKSNRFVGLLDNVTVYRGLMSDQLMASRFRMGDAAPPGFAAERMPEMGPVPTGQVLVTLGEGLPSADRWLLEGEQWPRESMRWISAAFLLHRLPIRYDDWGIRDAWSEPVLLRMAADVDLTPGTHRLLMRVRGMGRLWIDGELIAQTEPVTHKSPDGEQPVTPLAEPPLPGMRPHGYRQQEVFAEVDVLEEKLQKSNRNRIVLELVVGGPGQRTESGEVCIAMQAPGDESFNIVTPFGSDGLRLTDAAVEIAVDRMEQQLAALDDGSRRRAASSQDAFWARRHQIAADWAAEHPAPMVPAVDGKVGGHPVDAFIARKIANVVEAANLSDPRATQQFYGRVLPILREACFRCHGEKDKGGLKLNSREAALHAGESEQPAVVPGDPEASQMMQQIRSGAMPPTEDGLSLEQVEILEQWIRDGAAWPAPRVVFEAADEPSSVEPKRLDSVSPDGTLQKPDALRRNSEPDAQPLMQEAGVVRIASPPIVDDEVFLRRVYLDTVGVPPTLAESRRFLGDPRPDKRRQLIDELLGDERLADHWISLWQDLLAENPTLLNQSLGSTGPFRWFLHDSLRDNKPLDRMTTELILMRGSPDTGGSAGFSMSGESDAPLADKAHILAGAFLGVELQCARCHDSPYHSTLQRDLYSLAAMLERKSVKVPASSRVADAFFENKGRESLIRVTLKPDESVAAEWPLASLLGIADGSHLDPLMINPDDSRERLATLITAPQNRRFGRVVVNRVWRQLMGAGLVEPVDDWEGQEASHPELLDWLVHEWIIGGYDLRVVMRSIMTSQVYQRAALGQNAHADAAQRFFAAPERRRLTAEQIVDSLHVATGSEMNVEELTFVHDGQRPLGKRQTLGSPKRAWMFASLNNERDRPSLSLPRARAVSDVLQAFGWNGSRQKPVSVRDTDPNVLQPGVLSNGTLAISLTRAALDSDMSQSALEAASPEALVDEWFLRILCRRPSPRERGEFATALSMGFDKRVIPDEQVRYPDAPPELPLVTWFNHLQSETNTIQQERERRVVAGPPPDPRLDPSWRAVYEDFVWSLVNHREFVWIP